MKHALSIASRRQEFWVSGAVLAAALILTATTPQFGSSENFYNIARNLSFVALVALGQTCVIISGGIDLSVGSIMGLTAVVAARMFEAGYSFPVGATAALALAAGIGLVNGSLITVFRLSPFVVTLGTLSIVRSLAIVVTGNKMIYEFGSAESALSSLGGGSFWGIPGTVIIAVVVCLLLTFLLRSSVWGLHLYAVGSNDAASRLCGVSVSRVRVSAYVVCALLAGTSGILMTGWLGSVTNQLGTGYELTVIAAAVIGGANLSGGAGSAYGAFIGAVLIEVIRNALLMVGVDPYWQGTFVGLFILVAVLLERIQARIRE